MVDNGLWKNKLDTRPLGWYFDRDNLLNNINRCGRDLVECRWDYIVIEEKFEGLGYPVVEDSEYWLEFDDDINNWSPCSKPSEVEGTICWSC